MKAKLTKTLIDKLKPRADNWYIAWDSDLRGFGVRVNRDGSKAFILYYRTKSGQRQRKTALGRYGEVTLEQARDKAKEWLGEVAGGGDPAGRQHEERQVETIAELAGRYLRDYADVHKKASSVKEDRLNLDNRILPALGRHKVTAVTQKDVTDFHLGMKETPIQANRCLALLSKMFAEAAGWGIVPRGHNPCSGVRRFKEAKRERYLDADELARLGVALEAAEETEGTLVVDALRVLILTGARLGEIQKCRWEWVDWRGAKIDLPEEASKTGKKSVLLPAPALVILKRMKEAGCGLPWVVPGVKGETYANLHKPWEKIREAAGLGDVRIHDLRHCFATIGVSLGLGLPIIGGLLGHSKPETTARYGHLANDPARAAAAAIGDALHEALGAKVEVIEIAPEASGAGESKAG